MLRKVLIANRGEIALRILRACRELGIEGVPVFSDADRDAPHACASPLAVGIGGKAPSESYLDASKLVRAAREAGCQAVHPGYGFLSENPAFAEAVAAAGLVFVGPSPQTMRRMGDKLGARRLMHDAGLPVTPGSLEATRDPSRLAKDARGAGYPVMLKAARGGGGRGIRRIEDEKALLEAVPQASAEAERAFGDGTLYVERCVERARHVEVQVFGNPSGAVVHLGERECSLQRRHQKVLEETPSPALDAGTREALCAAAVRGASAVGYLGAGTMEFLYEAGSGRFYFMEMNQRLQVEHPVTELVTGLDLVQAQLRAASGEPEVLRQADVSPRGHAVEVRLCAEDPASFLPSTGRVDFLRLPGGPGIRIDGMLQEGLEVTPFYDSLLAKVCAWAPSRSGAFARLSTALDDLRVGGIRTNLPMLRALAARPEVLRGAFDTRTLEGLAFSPSPETLAAAARHAARAEAGRRGAALLPPSAGSRSPWGASALEEGLRE